MDCDTPARSYRLLIRAFDRAVARDDVLYTTMRAALCDAYTFALNERLGDMFEMAQAKGKPRKSPSTEFKWNGFVNISLTKSQKENIQLWVDEYDNAFELMDMAQREGFKLTFAYNSKNRRHTATLTCTDMERLEGGYALSSFAHTSEKAVQVLMFKHFVVCADGWPLDGVDDDDEEAFG